MKKTREIDFFTTLKRIYASGWLFFFSLLLSFIGGILVVNFHAAITPEQAPMQGYPPLPIGWEAGVFNHGEYIHWLTIQKHPILYAICLVIQWGPAIIWAPMMIRFYIKSRRM
ncbi:MAG: hypothetical protein IPP66_04495 [Anaerolineales bacterium]|nr:hypothetical protein [Anaerolineales bacterium]